MGRLARVVAEGMPHHIVQRGNRRQKVFFEKGDKQKYLELLNTYKKKYELKVWSYCLMDNHVHLIVVPQKASCLAKAIGETHKEYTRMINFREGWRGYLWEGRFKSFVLDERYLYSAVRYVERNPVRAKMVDKAEDFEYSSARFRIKGLKSDLLDQFYLINEIKDWSSYLSDCEDGKTLSLFRRHGNTGRPLGDKLFLEQLARKLGVDLHPKKPGPKPKV